MRIRNQERSLLNTKNNAPLCGWSTCLALCKTERSSGILFIQLFMFSSDQIRVLNALLVRILYTYTLCNSAVLLRPFVTLFLHAEIIDFG